MVNTNELGALDAMAQADLVRQGEITAIELVEAAIERIEKVNPRLNAVITPMYDLARKTAKGTLPKGPFTGVPFLLKDLLAAYAGVRMASGSRLLQNYVPAYDSELVKRYKRAGLIILGKTNTPEFGTIATTEPQLFGPTRNPWDTERTSGGSSGGSAVAVASRMVPMAHGNDGGGSIRIPASCCGVFGLKPTRARISLGPEYGDIMSGLVVEHALTRSVRDSAALLDAVRGPALGDPYWAPPPKRAYINEIDEAPGQLRIAYSTETFTGVETHKDCIKAVNETVKLCEKLDHEVDEATVQLNGEKLTQAFLIIWSAERAAILDNIADMTGQQPTPEQVEPHNWWLIQMGRQSTAANYHSALQMLHRVTRDFAKFLQDYDVWLTPTLAEPPVPLGTFAEPPNQPFVTIFRTAEFMPMTPIANITGHPAMSMPLHWNSEGLPIGLQFIGRFGDEGTLFRLAAQLEKARPWAHRKPPVCA